MQQNSNMTLWCNDWINQNISMNLSNLGIFIVRSEIIIIQGQNARIEKLMFCSLPRCISCVFVFRL